MRDPWMRPAAAFACAALAALSPGTSLAQATSPRPPETSVVKVGDRAPAFSLAGGDGQTYRLADLHAKNRLVLVIFRGTW